MKITQKKVIDAILVLLQIFSIKVFMGTKWSRTGLCDLFTKGLTANIC